jgi:hypothetical protein
MPSTSGPRLLAVVSALAWCGAACQSASAPLAPRVLSTQPAEPYVAAQAEFTIALVDPIAKDAIGKRRSFRARVEYPVRSPENEIVIQTNALVRGEIVTFEAGPMLVVNLKFDQIETVWGPARLVATVRSAEPYALVTLAPTSPATMLRSADADASLYPLGGAWAAVPRSPTSAVGGGPRSTSDSPGPVLPAGATMRLVLAAPIIPPRPKGSLR